MILPKVVSRRPKIKAKAAQAIRRVESSEFGRYGMFSEKIIAVEEVNMWVYRWIAGNARACLKNLRSSS